MIITVEVFIERSIYNNTDTQKIGERKIWLLNFFVLWVAESEPEVSF